MSELNVLKENITLFSVLSTTLERIKGNASKEKGAAVKLSAKESSGLKYLKKHTKLSETQFHEIGSLVLTFDPNLRLIQQITSVVVTNSEQGVAGALVDECARLGSVWLSNEEQAYKQSVFFRLWEGSSSNNSIQRYMDLLENQIQLSIKKLAEDTDSVLDANRESTSIAKSNFDKNQIAKNMRSIGLLWLITKGLVENESIIDFLINQYSHDIEILPKDLRNISIYLTEISLPIRERHVLMLAQYLTQQRAEVQRAKVAEANRRDLRERELSFEQQKTNALQLENNELVKKIAVLKESLSVQQAQIQEQHELGKAERVHLKDDQGKIKHKTLNTLEEDVLPLLSKTSHALDKGVPKVHVAIHQLELITEEIEGLIKWLKK